jgi:hypothetical protein
MKYRGLGVKKIWQFAAIAAVLLFAGSAAAQPAGWCTPGAKLEVFWVSTWFHATVKGPAPGGRCTVGYDGWSHTWDEAITVGRAAAAGTKEAHSSRPGAATAQPEPVATGPGGPPLLGIYECMEQSGMPNLYQMFGLLDGSTYATYDRKTGKYRFNAGNSTITMVSGPLAGSVYQRDGRLTNFHLIAGGGGPRASMNCPHNPVKNPRHYPW